MAHLQKSHKELLVTLEALVGEYPSQECICNGPHGHNSNIFKSFKDEKLNPGSL